MQSPFNIEYDFLEQKRLRMDFESDPIAVCEKLRAVLEQCQISARVVEAMQSSEENIQKALRSIHSSANTAVQSVGQRDSVFRGGDDSARAYRALVPFLLVLEGRRGVIRTETRNLFRWRDCLIKLRPLMDGVFGGVMALELFAAEENIDPSIAQTVNILKQDAKNELDLQRQLSNQLESDLSWGETLERDVICVFLNRIYEASDSEHDGQNCHCTKVLELITNFREKLAMTSFESE